jgi:hypothetical protein
MTPTIDEIQTLEEFTMADLAAANIPAGLVAAIATAQNELIANEQEQTQSSLRLATEQANQRRQSHSGSRDGSRRTFQASR